MFKVEADHQLDFSVIAHGGNKGIWLIWIDSLFFLSSATIGYVREKWIQIIFPLAGEKRTKKTQDVGIRGA